MSSPPEVAGARIHWLVAGRFSSVPTGESWVATPGDLESLLRARIPEIRVRVTDRLGGGPDREIALHPASLRAFTLAGVVEAVPELKALRSTRESAVFDTALEVLGAEPLRSLEASWRGLRMLLAACPEGSDIAVEVLDATPEEVPALLRQRPASDDFGGPDVVFVTEPVGSMATLAALADLGEELLAPCVAAPTSSLLGAALLDEVATAAERQDPAPAEWDELRASGAARWLCCPVNPVVLQAEGAGAWRRVCLGSPAWAVAAMLSASYRAQGAFASAVGKGGAMVLPGSWTVPTGPHKGKVAPTATFLPIPAQTALAGRGVLALGSVVNSDRAVLVSAPMVAAGRDVAPLPAQILTGRIVRFARWARLQVDPTKGQDEVATLMAQAAGIFLFPRMPGAAAIGARVKGEGDVRVLEFGARVNPSHALVPLEIAFELPL